MTDHLSDRRRVERLMLVGLFCHVVRDGAADLAEPETAETLRRLDAVFDDLFPRPGEGRMTKIGTASTTLCRSSIASASPARRSPSSASSPTTSRRSSPTRAS